MYGGKFAFQNRLGQLAVGRKLTIFTVFYFVFEGKFQIQAPRGAYIWRGDLTEGFLRYDFGGLIFRRAYTWRGLFSEFYSSFSCRYKKHPVLCEHQCLSQTRVESGTSYLPNQRPRSKQLEQNLFSSRSLTRVTSSETQGQSFGSAETGVTKAYLLWQPE